MAKATTRERFERQYARRPSITKSEMKDRLGVTRQRVAQLEAETRITLERSIAPKAEVGACTICGEQLDNPGTTTHARCHTVTLTCAGCGVTFERKRRDVDDGKPAYHSRPCFAKNRGKA